MIFHENQTIHEISLPYLKFLKKRLNLKLLSAANYRWCFKVKPFSDNIFPLNYKQYGQVGPL